VAGVPTFLINGRLLFGAQPLAVYRQAINAALTAPGPGPAR